MMLFRIEVEGKPKRFANLYWNDALFKKVLYYPFRAYLRELQSCRSKEELLERWEKIDQRVAYNQAIRFLAMRAYFAEELAEKLRGKGISEQAIESAIARCIKIGYIDDQSRLKRSVEVLIEKGFGPRMIVEKLKRLGRIEERGIEEVLKDCEQRILEKLEKIIAKRFSKKLSIKEQRRAFSYLIRRGFNIEDIKKSLK